MATRSVPVERPAAIAPSKARYWVVFFAVTLAILSYIDRVCISMAMPVMARDLGLTKSQQGLIFSAFGIAYALFEIPGGWLGDRIGARKVLMRIVLWWSAFTALTGAMTNFISLWIVRFLFGAGEAGCFPNITKAFSAWLPTSERVRAQGTLWMFARWGGAFTPPLVIAIFRIMDWRSAFVLFGCLGVIWAVFFYRWYRDKPSEHPAVNSSELALLAENERNVESHGDVPWGKLLGSKNIWLLWLQYFFLSYPWYFYITWLPSYLQEQRRLSPEVAAQYAILPLFFGGLGSLVSGFISNRVALVLGSVVRARQVLACLGFAGGAVLLIVTTRTGDPLYAMLAMGLASFCNDLVMPGAWATCMDIGGRYAGTVAGSMNMMGNIAGFVAPAVGGYILQQGGSYNSFIYTMAAMYVLGFLCWPFIRSDQRLE
ncbi:MAG TPA: MFS transporter [Bryobacteraceae bacterium]|nr:MFS transporter [Bryobacteraceae bacterium]